MVPDGSGTPRRWHLLDNTPSLDGAEPVGTVLCVHGNPTWSYLWRHVAARLATGDRPWRVIAVDQLNMGFSERTGLRYRIGDRISDLTRLTDELGLHGPVVTMGHDWGGGVAFGWAIARQEQLAGMIVLNTAVHQPPGTAGPILIRLANLPVVRWTVTSGTQMFLRTTLAIAHPRLPKKVREAYLAPYRGWRRRIGIGHFVEDIPMVPGHPSWDTRTHLREGVDELGRRGVPTLMLWGPKDPVFQQMYLRDLRSRLPQADVHRFEKAGHLLAEDADVAGAAASWLAALDPDSGASRPGVPAAPEPEPEPTRQTAGGAGTVEYEPLWRELDERADSPEPCIVGPIPRGGTEPVSMSWNELAGKVRDVAAGLTASGINPGDRIALLIPPGPELTVALYACLRVGAVIVVADAGLGVAGLSRAIRSASPRFIVGIDRALVAARALGWPGHRIGVERAGATRYTVRGTEVTLDGLAEVGHGRPLPPEPAADSEAAVVFTSGSTGPAKGVVYTYRQLAAARNSLLRTYPVGPGDRLVAAFAPFALFGPSLGVTSSTPDMDVTAPRTLTAAALADAAGAIEATAVFASPAALANIVATKDQLSGSQRTALERIRLVLSAGAPVPPAMLSEVLELMPQASAHTPYGMTEVLPVTDVDLEEVIAAGPGNGVLVGAPIPGVTVSISALDGRGRPTGDLTDEPDVTGEIVIRAAHVKERYDQLWLTQHDSAVPAGWHRSGDVGHLDGTGRLWVEGRLAHILTTAAGVVTPVGVEQRIETVPTVTRAALVGVGPEGTQVPVAVVETTPPLRRDGRASTELAERVRAVAGIDLVAVLGISQMPTDIRHNAKIDRTRLGRWAARVLSGARGGSV
jgi:acyl-CoA synthetase (AMP-forming)/AMP-acid ligase II/alpha-beta hydrolase superfamily lysophospholipase